MSRKLCGREICRTDTFQVVLPCSFEKQTASSKVDTACQGDSDRKCRTDRVVAGNMTAVRAFPLAKLVKLSPASAVPAWLIGLVCRFRLFH